MTWLMDWQSSSFFIFEYVDGVLLKYTTKQNIFQIHFMPFFDILFDFTCFMGWKWISIITIPLFVYLWQNKQEIKLTFDRTEKGSYFVNFSSAFTSSCQVEGHGGTLSKFSLKTFKNFPLQIWKIFCFLISLYDPLSNAIWILDWHPLV